MASALAPGLSRKVKKILDIQTESPDLLSSLEVLSEFYTDNDAASRRKLQSLIESRSLSINEDFLKSAEVVVEALNKVEADLEGLSKCCGAISGALAESQASTVALLAETVRVQKELARSERRSALVQTFLNQYQLANAEVLAIQEGEIGDQFFAALTRVRQIHANCRSLLRTHHQRAGLELMDSMALFQETAYERLCRWVQAECAALSDADAPDIDPQLQRAARALHDRPILCKYCADEVATARHNSLFQRFITALTRGGPGGRPRPIEMHAHDPRRYVADMLAWVHQAIASERELLVALFGDDSVEDDKPAENGRSDDVHLEGAAEMPATSALLDRVFESICRPLKVRVEQVLLSSPPVLLCFQLLQLLAFYSSTMSDICGPSAALVATLEACQDVASRVFTEQLKAKGDRLLRAPPPPPSDRSPPPQVAETLHQLTQILDAYESLLGGGAGEPPAALAGLVSRILGASLDPLLEMCERSAEALASDSPARLDERVLSIDPTDHAVYLINCLGAAQAPLSTRPCASSYVELLSGRIDATFKGLVAGSVGRVLGQCGMADIVNKVQMYMDGGDPGAMSGDASLAPEIVAEAMRAFFGLVSAPDTLPEFERLALPKVRANAVLAVAHELADAYACVYEAYAPGAPHGFAADALAQPKHTPAQVRTILGITS